MAEGSVRVRSAEVEEEPQGVSCITAAFIADPFTRFAWPSPHDYLRFAPELVRAFGGAAFEAGSAYVTEDFCGAAFWLPPEVHPDGEAMLEIFRESVRAEALDDLLATVEEMERYHPAERHWYLPLIGVEPNAQGRGLGGALMHHALTRCDQEDALAYLESSNPRNISLYRRYGFEVMGEIRKGDGPLVTPMLRHPRKP